MAHWSIRLKPDVRDFWPPLDRFQGRTRIVLRTLLVPVSIVAMIGYGWCCIIVATATLYLPLQFMEYRPGAGWAIWAAVVLVIYCGVMLAIVAEVVQYARKRVIDLPGIPHALLFVLGLLLAAWFIPNVIKDKPPSPAEPAQTVADYKTSRDGQWEGPRPRGAVGAVEAKLHPTRRLRVPK